MKTTDQYVTNDLNALKRQALGNKDLDTLQSIRTYDEHRKSRLYFYVKEDEEVIRDTQGREIAQSELPFPKDENSLHFARIPFAPVFEKDIAKPGDLMREIAFVINRREKFSAWILEVPSYIVFPVPGGFGWWVQICLDYIASGRYVPNKSSIHDRRLNGYSDHDKKMRLLWVNHVNKLNGRTVLEP
ncbi:hypothetical protein [Dyadobacter sp. LHD-138]|uniref:hypothetical protein n=1 Tax=Dyadobacter sp. LHD-138 TaxID=3071413 RepID=UPI0027E0C13C|nr:hypothetical protein [Dyadobacter sp. LHD-138]MDQ6482340.1 hypothetical protein [Dyadobacter sp. LHD-138]